MPSIRELIISKIHGRADVIIGKSGISNGVINEIKRRLKEQGIVKVKVLKSGIKASGLDRKSLAREVATRVNAKLVDIRGRTFILVKES
ncbi:MAG: YhbY family RNA-binding protein [Pyrodictiaceae archaeon]